MGGAIGIIAVNTFREIIRDRILYGIVVFALLLFGISVVLGQFSFVEQARISADFGFTGIQLGLAIVAIFAGSTLVAREIEKQTILTLLARPVTRTQFILGKFAGLGLVVTVVLAGLAAVLLVLLVALELKIEASFAVALLGVWLESLILIAMAMFFGSFSRPVMSVAFVLAFFLIGNCIKTLDFFIEKSQSDSFKILATVVSHAVPNFEILNWRSEPVYGLTVPASVVFGGVGYGVAWTIALLAGTAIIFGRRDFV